VTFEPRVVAPSSTFGNDLRKSKNAIVNNRLMPGARHYRPDSVLQQHLLAIFPKPEENFANCAFDNQFCGAGVHYAGTAGWFECPI
jgi:hypothetical protein